MNERFKALPEEKQRSILRAATEVFARYEYKKASTDLIATKAGVSKGLLFYYFHNKKELYLTAFEYLRRVTAESVADTRLLEITDFFELIAYASVKKFKIMAENPYITEFAVRSFYSENEEISDGLKSNIEESIRQSYDQYFRNLDFSKFKEDVDPFKIFKMMFWLTDGYLHEQRMYNAPLCLPVLEQEMASWTAMLKKIAYKEEYI